MDNLVQGQANLSARDRGHADVHREAMSGSLFDCGLFVFHNAQTLGERRLGPFFYLPRWKATSRHGCGTTSSP